MPKPDRPQNRNLRPNPTALGVVLLGPDEESKLLRIRASPQAIRKLSSMTAKERGEAIEAYFNLIA